MRPPHRSRASTTVTRFPARASSRAAMRPAAPAPIIRKFVSGPSIIVPGLPSLQAVEPHRTASQHLALGLWRQRREPVTEHLRRAGEEAVLMRIIGRPHDLVRADILGQRGDAALDRLERDPAIALEQFARPRFRRGLIEA